MDALELLATRASNAHLREPAPDDATLAEIVEAALRAPDHAALRPWLVLSLRGEARNKLGDLCAAAHAARDPKADAATLERERKKALRGPLVLVVAAVVHDSPKVPEIEQVMSAALVAHGILLGLQARGFGGSWRTGANAYDASIKQALGLRDRDHLVGFVYVGTPESPPPAMTRPLAKDFLRPWR